MNIGNIAVLEMSGVVKKDSDEIGRLMHKAVLVLKLLYSKPNVLFTREEIMKRAWGHDHLIYVRSLDVYVNQIRKQTNLKIVNQKGVGYKLLIN